MANDFTHMSALEMIGRIKAKEISPVETTRAALDLAAATQDSINAFCLLTPDAAMADARAMEAAIMRGDPVGPLAGVPFSVKDLIAVGGLPYESGSRAMKGNIAADDAPSVERAKAAGAIFIGKTTTSEFGCKPVGDSPVTGITRNPLNLDKTLAAPAPAPPHLLRQALPPSPSEPMAAAPFAFPAHSLVSPV